MLKNYFKIAIAVLKRRKFFTFVSLFVISFTLAVLMVMTAFIDKIINDDYPDRKRDRSLYVTRLVQEATKIKSTQMASLSYSFLNRYAVSLHTPVNVSISSLYRSANTYVNNKKIVVDYKYTDANYWDVMEYTFTEGKPYTKQQVAKGELVAVISEDLKKEYFGPLPSVIGKWIEADNVRYRVSGVVKSVPITTYLLYAGMYIPYTVSKADYRKGDYMGNYMAVLLAGKKDDLPKIQEEYRQVVRRIPPENKQFDTLYSHANSYALAAFGRGKNPASDLKDMILFVSIFVVLFMLLPTLNLININVTRIMERSSEIGVRKAFGASSRTLVYQFLVENIILTVLGGLIGVALAVIIVYAINNANLINNLHLSLNFTVLFYGLLTCIFFGLLSGVYPAWRMSRFSAVTALKG